MDNRPPEAQPGGTTQNTALANYKLDGPYDEDVALMKGSLVVNSSQVEARRIRGC